MANEIQTAQKTDTVPVSDNTTLMAVIAKAASDPQVDVEKMERLWAMHERMEQRNAESAFNAAMKEAQSRIGRVATDAANNQTRSRYATYAALDRVVRPIYTQCGFALSFGTEDSATPETLRVVCWVSHDAGFTRKYHADMPADGKGAKGADVMTKTHAAGSAMSYGQRYLLKLIFNIAIGNDPDDDDGNGAAGEQYADWKNLIRESSTKDELKVHKREACQAFGLNSVPPPIIKAFMARGKELSA